MEALPDDVPRGGDTNNDDQDDYSYDTTRRRDEPDNEEDDDGDDENGFDNRDDRDDDSGGGADGEADTAYGMPAVRETPAEAIYGVWDVLQRDAERDRWLGRAEARAERTLDLSFFAQENPARFLESDYAHDVLTARGPAIAADPAAYLLGAQDFLDLARRQALALQATQAHGTRAPGAEPPALAEVHKQLALRGLVTLAWRAERDGGLHVPTVIAGLVPAPLAAAMADVWAAAVPPRARAVIAGAVGPIPPPPPAAALLLPLPLPPATAAALAPADVFDGNAWTGAGRDAVGAALAYAATRADALSDPLRRLMQRGDVRLLAFGLRNPSRDAALGNTRELDDPLLLANVTYLLLLEGARRMASTPYPVAYGGASIYGGGAAAAGNEMPPVPRIRFGAAVSADLGAQVVPPVRALFLVPLSLPPGAAAAAAAATFPARAPFSPRRPASPFEAVYGPGSAYVPGLVYGPGSAFGPGSVYGPAVGYGFETAAFPETAIAARAESEARRAEALSARARLFDLTVCDAQGAAGVRGVLRTDGLRRLARLLGVPRTSRLRKSELCEAVAAGQAVTGPLYDQPLLGKPCADWTSSQLREAADVFGVSAPQRGGRDELCRRVRDRLVDLYAQDP